MMPAKNFDTADICSACDLGPKSPHRLAAQVNGVVRAAFQNLLARGMRPQEAARSALIVLRIHQPGLCPCNLCLVKEWLLATALPH